MKKKLLFFLILLSVSMVVACAKDKNTSTEKKDEKETVTEKSEIEPCETLTPELEAGQHPGVAILLDYEGNDTIIFHGTFGLFVYDTKEEKMLRMLDLEYIGCDAVQGADCCQIRVTEDGSEIYLSRIENNEYTEMYIYKWEEDALYKISYQQDISEKAFYDSEKSEGILIEGNSLGEIYYKLGDREIKIFNDIS